MAVLQALQALSPAAVAANTTAEQTFNLAGVEADTVLAEQGVVTVLVNKPSAQVGLGIVGSRFIPGATPAVGITFSNNTAGGITPTAGELYVITLLWSPVGQAG